jgi:probable ATP-dependent RNA helicase DDX4
MLDMGFMADVDELVAKMRPKEDRISGMFSATFPTEVQNSAKKFLHDYVYIVIGVVGGACKDVKQEIMRVEKSEKRQKILEIIRAEEKDTKILIFCGSKKGADFLATHLATNQVSCTSIHGDRLQSQREQALREFTNGKRQVLVATAVAARGLDIPKVGLVINYDLPSEIDEYVHRIGRTGRVGHTGRAISFYDSEYDTGLLSSLMGILKGADQTVPTFLEEEGAGGGFIEGGFASTDVRDGAGGAPPAAQAEDDDEDW